MKIKKNNYIKTILYTSIILFILSIIGLSCSLSIININNQINPIALLETTPEPEIIVTSQLYSTLVIVIVSIVFLTLLIIIIGITIISLNKWEADKKEFAKIEAKLKAYDELEKKDNIK